jgi:hypothetical protein
MEIEIQLDLERATKNTFRFTEVTNDTPVIGSLYVQKAVFSGRQPATLRVTIAWD